MTDIINIEQPEEAPTLFKVSLDIESDEPYINWIKTTIGARWVDIQNNGLNIIRENRDGVIYIYNESSDSWDIDVI
jgi:hypothetical protein